MLLLSLEKDHPRRPVRKIASYHYGGKRFLTLTLDLGLGGMKIKTHHYLPEGDDMNFKLVLGNSSIRVKGKIVYSGILPDEESVSDIQFLEVSAGDYTLLQDYLGKLEKWPKPRGMLSSGEKTGRMDNSRTGEK